MKRRLLSIAVILCILILPITVISDTGISIITATGEDVPSDSHLPEEYRFPAEYRDNAVQFRTSDGVLLCGYVLGDGSRGITLGHANGWMPKSWVPFAERLVEEGYMVIIWEYRNIPPSGSAPESASLRWDLDVLAAAQVLRERGAASIIAIGASDGGNATAVAAPYIADLAGIALLSSPANSKGDGLAGLRNTSAPAFFAVSRDDPGGDFYTEVQALYDASASSHKELYVLTSYEHGTDLLSETDAYSAKVGSTEEQKQERRQLADDLLTFVSFAFADAEANKDKPDSSEDMSTDTPVPSTDEIAVSDSPVSGTAPTYIPAVTPVPENTEETTDSVSIGTTSIGTVLLPVVCVALLGAAAIRLRRRK